MYKKTHNWRNGFEWEHAKKRTMFLLVSGGVSKQNDNEITAVFFMATAT